MAKDIILLGLYFKDNIIQESSIVLITADTMTIVNITVSIINNNCIGHEGLV